MFLAEGINIAINSQGLAVALIGVLAALSVGLIGSKGVEAIGRNPGAFTPVLIFGLIGMALAEGLAILIYFVVKV